jgi:hypothetical protein
MVPKLIGQESQMITTKRGRHGVWTVRSAAALLVLSALLLGSACSSKECRPSAADKGVAPGNGGQTTLTGVALVDLLKARRYGIGNYDAAIVEVLRIQCGVLPPPLSLRKEDIGKILPLERLDDASIAFCGAFLLNDGTYAVAPAFKDIIKPAN